MSNVVAPKQVKAILTLVVAVLALSLDLILAALDRRDGAAPGGMQADISAIALATGDVPRHL